MKFTHTRWTAVRKLIECKRDDAFYSLVYVLRCYFGQYLKEKTDVEVLSYYDRMFEHVSNDVLAKPKSHRNDVLKKTFAMYEEVCWIVGPTGNINADFPDHRKSSFIEGKKEEQKEQKKGSPVHHPGQNWADVPEENQGNPTSKKASRKV